MDDLCSAEGARSLAVTIEKFWIKRGYRGIQAWVEPIAMSYQTKVDKMDKRDGFAVRSNIGPNGMPPRERQQFLEAA